MNSRNIFKYGSWAMIVTGVIHLIGHFSTPPMDTEEKKEMYRLMNELQFEMDPWFSRSVYDLFDAFSLFLTVMLLTLGIVNLIIVGSDISSGFIKRLSLVNLIGMAAMLALSLVYAFSVPIALFFIVMTLMLAAYLRR